MTGVLGDWNLVSDDHVHHFVGETEIYPKNECWERVDKQGAGGAESGTAGIHSMVP